VVTSLIPAIASIIGIIITVIGQWINSRNDRNLTNQELDILKKLDSNSRAARELSQVIESRIETWRKKAMKSERLKRRALVLVVVSYILVLLLIPLWSPTSFREYLIAIMVLAGLASVTLAAIKYWQALTAQRRERRVDGSDAADSTFLGLNARPTQLTPRGQMGSLIPGRSHLRRGILCSS
jgi:hypothetical protein